MRQILPLLLLSFLLLLTNVNAQQKSTFTLKGTVIDSTANAAVQFATLTVAKKENPNSQIKAMATDEKGNFQVALNAQGDYVLSIFYFGSKAADIPFTIDANQKETNLGTIYIAEESVLKEAVIVAQKPLVTVELDKLTYDTESDPDSKTETALEMLRKVPMVTVDAEDKIQLRGSSNFKVYVNGKPSTMVTSNPSEVLKSMPAGNIKNIEVITDPGAKYDAEGIGGIINITMVKRTDDGYTATIGAHANSQGAYGGNGFLTLKYGKFGFSGNYGYNHWTRGKDETHSVQNFLSSNSTITRDGKSKQKMPMQWGSGELTYEFDTLNMLTISFNRHYGKPKVNGDFEVYKYQNNALVYSYFQRSNTTQAWGDTEVNANFQHSFKKKGELLTASYRFNNSPNDNDGKIEIYNTVNYSDLLEQRRNEASLNEHTFQLDYVNPIKNKHTVEVGAKYIIRLNNSDVFFEEYDYGTTSWVHNPNRENDMDYRQDIVSGYGSYSYKLKKFGLKFGLRVENTNTDANFRQFDGTYNSINNSITDIVPSAALSYQLAMTKTLRLNYNMRIRRPGITYLNPFIDDSDPTNISYGNPDLESEKSNNISLSYGSFSQKFNMNMSVRYSYVDKAIERYTKVINGIYHSTYGNIGESHTTAFDIFASWTPIKDLRLMVNGSVSYVDLNSNNQFGDSNYGFGGNIFANASYTFLKSFRAGLFGGMFKQAVELQTEMSTVTFMGLSIGKDFLDKKLSVNIMARDPFFKYKDITFKSNGRDFNQENKLRINQQAFGIRVSYKFGNLKNQQIKKVQRGITNDDLMQNSGGNTSGAENTPQ